MDMKDLLSTCVDTQSSDLHISPQLAPMLRTHGDLHPIEGQSVLSDKETKELIYSVMSKGQLEQLEEHLELDFAVDLPGKARFRVNAFNQMLGLAAVFRVIPEEAPTLEALNLPDVLKDLCDLPNGIILVTGPTGSGKSTTLAAMVNHININRSEHIITIEDPIEFTHQSKNSLINQRQVHRDTKSFAVALRSALREDPDVILVGEMRDLETIRLALTAAETGHLVMATLHTSSAPRTVTRIIDVFPGDEKSLIRNMLSESIRGVICQTLVKSKTGGRAAALEIMLGTPAIRNLIREEKIAQMVSSIQTGSALGMCTLDQYLQQLVTKDIITTEEARANAVDKSLF